MSTSLQPLSRVPAAVKFGILLATILLLLYGTIDHLWGSQADSAHHYSLVARLSQHWTLIGDNDPSLGEMNYYPRNSHILAAVIGKLVHSPLLGMQLVAQLSIMGVWIGLGAILLTLPRRAALGGIAILGLLLLLNRRFAHLEIFGVENLGNFFYAQLLAQVFMVVALWGALKMERRGAPAFTRYGFLICAVYFLTGTHLLPASQLVSALLALIALDFLPNKNATNGAWKRTVLAGLAFMVAGVLVFVKHPAFAAMKAIAGNDGSLTLSFFNTMPRIAIYGVVIALLSLALVLTWVRMERKSAVEDFLALKYIGVFGLAASSLCLLQLVLLNTGHGSAYAVKKHIFSMNSMFFLELAMLPILLFKRQRQAAVAPHRGLDLLHTTLALPLLTALSYSALSWNMGGLNTSDLVDLEHKLELRRDIALSIEPGKYNYAMGLPHVPAWVDYMMSIGIFASPRTDNSQNLLAGVPLSERDIVGTIITGAQTEIGKMKDCLLPGSTSELSIVHGACALKQLAQPRPFIGFTSADRQVNCVLSGFGGAEGGGRWTTAHHAKLACPVPQIGGEAPHTLELKGAAFLHGGISQRLQVRLNGQAMHEFLFTPAQPQPVIVLKLPEGVSGDLEINLSLPDAVSPTKLGLGPDDRELGLMIQSLEFR